MARLSDDADYRRRIVATLYTTHGPAWMQRAACAGEDEPREWAYTDRFFTDEVTDAPKLVFPETVYRAMKTCHECPVRRECLQDAYETERHMVAIPKTYPERYREVEDEDRYGIRGGVPGQIRQRYARHPSRLDACERWFAAVARKRRWGIAEVMETLWGRVLHPAPTMLPKADNGG